MVERKGRVSATVVSDTKCATVAPQVHKKVLPETTIYTDEYRVYDNLNRQGYKHSRVHHAEEIYVAGDVHTNTIEGFWSLLKRGIAGLYHSVSAKHLQGYLNEYAYRYNHRKDERPMFDTMLLRVTG
jgi:transposase